MVISSHYGLLLLIALKTEDAARQVWPVLTALANIYNSNKMIRHGLQHLTEALSNTIEVLKNIIIIAL